MKRIGNLWEKIIDKENLYNAHIEARRGKARYRSVKRVDANIDYYIDKLHEMLITDTMPKEIYTFKQKIDKGKLRDLSILEYFPYRIFQWAIKLQIDDIINKKLIFHTYSGIVDKGTHEMQKHLIKEFRRYRYVLSTDIRKYYDSIPKLELKKVLYTVFKDNTLLKWLYRIINNYRPKCKTGIPLGNSISIPFSNIYLNNIDHKYTNRSAIKYYRFMDNIFIFSNNFYELKETYYELKKDLVPYKLKLHKYIINKTCDGCKIVGYTYTNHKSKASDKTYKSFRKTKKRIRQKKNKYGYITYHLRQSLNSKLGYIKHKYNY